MHEELTRSKDDSPIRLKSTRFGELVIPRDFVWDFPEGLVGLRGYNRFALINGNHDRDTMFMWLHSVERGDIALPVMNPLSVFTDYFIRQDESEIIRLKLDKAGEVQVLAIVSVPAGDPKGITANLAAPIVLDPSTHKGYQVILERGLYRVAQPLFPETETGSEESEILLSVGTSSPPVTVAGQQDRSVKSRSEQWWQQGSLYKQKDTGDQLEATEEQGCLTEGQPNKKESVKVKKGEKKDLNIASKARIRVEEVVTPNDPVS